MSENSSGVMKRLTAFVHGDVQRVGHRSRVVTIAKVYKLRGWVQNLPDGRVKVVAEGDTEDLERFIKAVKLGNSLVKVDKIDYEYSEPTDSFDSFYKLVREGEPEGGVDWIVKYLKELIDVYRNGVSDIKKAIKESQKKG